VVRPPPKAHSDARALPLLKQDEADYSHAKQTVKD
jgi:hypothetical protein